jgi:hypothetical protein
MSKTFRRACQWLVALSPLAIAIAALGQSPGSQVGREVAIPIHLQDGEEFTVSIPHLIQFRKERGVHCQKEPALLSRIPARR